MTLDYSIILPLMFVCVTADQVAWALSKESIYSLKLKRKGLSFVSDIGVNVMAVTLVRDIMTTVIKTASDNMTLKQAESKLLPSGHETYPVIDENGCLTGVIHREIMLQKIRKGRLAAKIEEFKVKAHVVVYPDDTVLRAIKKIENTRDPRIIVIDRKSSKLEGIVSPIDFVRLSSADAD